MPLEKSQYIFQNRISSFQRSLGISEKKFGLFAVFLCLTLRKGTNYQHVQITQLLLNFLLCQRISVWTRQIISPPEILSLRIHLFMRHEVIVVICQFIEGIG